MCSIGGGSIAAGGESPAPAVGIRHLLVVMVQILSGGTGRGEEEFIDFTSVFVEAIRIRVNGLPDIAADFSDRRNPRWYTLGHASLLWNDQVIFWESFLNYPDQFWTFERVTNQFQGNANQLGLPDNLDFPVTGEKPVTFRWQLRGNLSIDAWIAS